MTSPMSGHRAFTPGVLDEITRRAMTAAGGFPSWLVRLVGGRPREIDGARLDPHFQMGVRVMGAMGSAEYHDLPVEENRLHMEREAYGVSGRTIGLPSVRELTIPVPGTDESPAGALPARLYSPVPGDEDLPLLVYFHGGGWVLGSIDTHDATCRHICHAGELRVLSVDYRLAPEFLFPTAVDDAVAAFRWARDHAAELHADPGRIAVGGDSAGGNLSAVVCQQTHATGEVMPAFQLLFVPAVDMSKRTRSYELFAEGYFLTAAHMDYYEDVYLRSDADRTDVRASPLLAEDLSGLPPAYVAVAGFDPLRDEGEAYARRLAEAGVPVSLRRHAAVVHPFVNAVGASPLARAALSEAVGALRMGLRY